MKNEEIVRGTEIIRRTAEKMKITEEEMRRSLEDIIEKTWQQNDTSAEKKKLHEVFPDGKPTVEKFVLDITSIYLINNRLNRPITELGLSTRTCRALNRAYIITVRDLLALDWLDFVRIRDLGKKSQEAIIQKLEELGFNCDNLKESCQF